MKFKNPIPKIEREKRKELEATIKALKKKVNLTEAEIENERRN